ncbi:hypothetical protein PoB_003864300 [Plakobranchus ocellatus]|uniref:Secreted protein n=1 Tax=Plakobranchus ocellatus TaxID=259542 RepID=A0AAV4AZ72_9GAST|nr:hypothetical protein PoB_003864300 [Plakobranchus ocellatus]
MACVYRRMDRSQKTRSRLAALIMILLLPSHQIAFSGSAARSERHAVATHRQTKSTWETGSSPTSSCKTDYITISTDQIRRIRQRQRIFSHARKSWQRLLRLDEANNS